MQKKLLDSDNLCLAGGVALNCVANGKIYKNKIFENIWVQPAAGDAGGSLGAALALYYSKNLDRKIDKSDSMKNSYLGPKYNISEIEREIKDNTSKMSYEFFNMIRNFTQSS